MRRQVVHFEITTKLERYFKIHFVQQNPWLYTHFSTLSVSLHHLHFLTLRYRFQKTQIACWSWIAFIWGKRASEHKHISWLKFLAQPQVHEPTQRTVPYSLSGSEVALTPKDHQGSPDPPTLSPQGCATWQSRGQGWMRRVVPMGGLAWWGVRYWAVSFCFEDWTP